MKNSVDGLAIATFISIWRDDISGHITLSAPMPNLISEFKKEVLDDRIPVSSLLRRALIITKEQGDKENEKWITEELRGYPDKDSVPDYRDISGRPIFRDHYTGWQYVYTQNLSDEQVHKISTFKFSAPIADLESNAKEDIVAITYHPIAEKMLIDAMGGNPGIPAIQFNGKQFQEVLNLVRDKLVDWINDIPDVPEEKATEVAAAQEQPRYQPSGIRKYLAENKSWLFQGVGTEVLKGLVVVLLMLASFIGGYYLRKQPDSKPPQLSSEELKARIDHLTQGHVENRKKITQAIIDQQRDAANSYSNAAERQQAIADLHKDLEGEDATYQSELSKLSQLLEPKK